jgi:hypothetical protein
MGDQLRAPLGSVVNIIEFPIERSTPSRSVTIRCFPITYQVYPYMHSASVWEFLDAAQW